MSSDEVAFDEESVFEHGLGVETIDLDTQIVLIDGMRGNRLRLNATGADAWRLLGERRTFGELTELAASKWDVDKETCRAALTSFLEKLLDLGVVGGSATRTRKGPASNDD